jgi:hypothetical protein
VAVYTHFRTEVGKSVDRWWYRSTRGHGRDYILGTSSEYGVSQLAEWFFREVFRLHGLREYIDGDRDRKFLSAVWQEPNIPAGTELIPSTWFPPDDGIPGTWIILTPMITSMAQQQLAGIGSGGLPIWWWDPGIHLSDRLIQMMMSDKL